MTDLRLTLRLSREERQALEKIGDHLRAHHPRRFFVTASDTLRFAIEHTAKALPEVTGRDTDAAPRVA